MPLYHTSISDDLTKDHRGKVTFINFLDFLIKQQQGMDPFDEVVKVYVSRHFVFNLSLHNVSSYIMNTCFGDCNISSRHANKMKSVNF